MSTNIVPSNHVANNSQVKHNRIIAWVTGILTLLLALFAFVLSFNALTDLAQAHKVSIPPLFPFVVEFGVIIFSLNALFRSMNGESARWQWVLVIGSSLLAGAFNIAHADNDLVSKAMAAMPSLFLLLSFESFLSLIKYQVTRQMIHQSLVQMSRQVQELDTILSQQAHKRDKLKAQIGQLEQAICPNDTNLSRANDTRQAQMERRREQVLILTEQGMSQADIADELGVSLATIKRDTKALNGQVRVSL